MPISIGEIIGKLKLDPSGFTAGVSKAKDDARGFASALSGVMSQSVGGFASSLKSLGGNIAGFGADLSKAFAPVSALGAAALAASSDINKAFREIRVETGATGEDLAKLKGNFANVFASVPASAADAGAAIAMLNQLTGATGKTLEGLATQQLNLARITGAELKPQIEATSKAFNNWKISTEAQGPALDTLFKISQLTGTSVTALAQQVMAGGSAARIAGLSFEQTALLVGQLSKAGIDGTSILQGFAMAFKRIAQKDQTADPATVLQGVIEKIKAAGSAAEVNKLAIEAFGRSGIQMGEAIKAGRLNIEDLTKALANSKDTINGVAKDTQTFGEIMTVLKNRVELALAPLGRDMSATLKSLMPDLTALINIVTQISNAFTKLPDSTKAAVAGFVLLAGSIGPILIGFGALVAFIGGPLTIAITTLGAITAVMALDWAENMAQTGRATLSMRGEILELAKVLGTVMDILGAVGHALLGVFDATVGQLIGIVMAVKRVLNNDLAGAFDALKEGSRQAGREFNLAWDDVQGKWATRLQNMVWTAYDATSGFKGAGQAAAAAYQAGLNSTGLGLRTPFANLPQAPAAPMSFADTVKGMGAQTATAAHSAGEGAASKFLESFGKKMKGGGGGIAKAMVDVLQDGAEGLKAAIGKVDVGDLSVLFDKLKSKARAGATELKDALKVVTAAINEFAQSMGVSAKVNEAQVASMADGTRRALEQHTLAYKVAKDEIQRIQVEGLASNKAVFAATQAEIDKMTAVAKAKFAEFGGVFKIMPPLMTAFETVTADVTGAASSDIAKFAASSQVDFDKFRANLERLSAEAPKPFAAISIAAIDAADNLKKALSGNETLAVINAQLDIRRSIESTISTLEDYGKSLGLTGDALQRYVEDQIRNLGIFKGKTAEELAKIIEEHKKAAIQLPGIWNEIFGKLDSGTKQNVSNMLAVFSTFPGAVGDSLRNAQSQIEKWLAYLDSSTKLLQGLLGKQQTGLQGIFDSIAGIFKKTAQTAKSGGDGFDQVLSGYLKKGTSAFEGLASSSESSSSRMSTAMGAASAAIGAFMTGLTTANATGSKAFGAIAGGLQGAMQGFMVAGPWGALAGGVAGVLGGLFGGGKSAAQKEQERLQNEKLKADIAASAQATMNAALEGFQKALAFLDSLDQFTTPRKAKFQEFWKAMSRLMDGFVALAKKWQGENLEKDKAIAEAIGAVAQGIAAAPAAFDAINSSFTIPDTQFEVFFGNLDRFMTRFFARADVWIEGTAKRAMKVANRLASVVDLISPFAQGMKDLVDLKPVSDDALNALDDGLQKLITRIGAIADKFDKGWLKTLQFFSEKAQSALSLWKDAVEAIKATVDIPPLNEGAIDAVVANITAFITKLITASDSISAEALGKAASIANSILPIANAIKAWSEAAKLIHDYTAVAADTYDAILADFNRAISLINLMLGSAIDFLPKAIQFEDVMVQIANHLKAALDAFGPGLGAAASAFGLIVNTIQGGVPIGGGDVGGGSFAPSFAGGGAASSTASSSSIHVHVHAGTFVHESQLPDLIAEGLVKLKRTSRLQGILAT